MFRYPVYRRCRNSKLACPIPPVIKDVDGSSIIRSQTQNMRMAAIIHGARFRRGGRVTFANQKLNAFGSWAGAPRGSGSPPQNHF